MIVRLGLSLILIGFFCVEASAQEKPPVELFLGYSQTTVVNSHLDTTAPGIGFSAAFNKTAWLGLTVELSHHTNSTTVNLPIGQFQSQENVGLALVGPRVSYRSRFLTPFAHLLVGAASDRVNGGGVIFAPGPNLSSIVIGGGGGLDVSLSGHVALRVAQFDYLNFSSLDVNRVRFSTGLMYRF